MSTFAALAALLLLSASAISQIVAPDCSMTTWDWTYNTLNQNPCIIAAYLQSTCNGSSFTVQALSPGNSYPGPSGNDDTNLCMCNTVVYSLMSACDGCQGETWITWSDWVYNCAKVLPPSIFPNAVPSGTRLPQWTLLDVTPGNIWDSIESMSIGDSPEIGPGGTVGFPGSFTTTPTGGSPLATTATSSLRPTTSPSGGSRSNTGVIAGSVIGGIAIISIAVLGALYLRRQRPANAPSAALEPDGISQPRNEDKKVPSDDGTRASPSIHETPLPTERFYNPDDPTTFPEHQEVPYASDVPAQPLLSTHNATETPLANGQTSLPQGYHGLPTT